LGLRRLVGFRIYLHAGPHLFDSSDHHFFTGLHWALNHLHLSVYGTKLDDHRIYHVVRSENDDEVATLQFHRRRLRDEQCALQFLDRGGDTSEEAGPQDILVVRK
jgi:hypothetical protein